MYPVLRIQILRPTGLPHKAFRLFYDFIIPVVYHSQLIPVILILLFYQKAFLILKILHSLHNFIQRLCKGFSRIPGIAYKQSKRKHSQCNIKYPEKIQRLFENPVRIAVNQPDTQLGKQASGCETILRYMDHFLVFRLCQLLSDRI